MRTMGNPRDVLQSDNTVSHMFPRYLLCPYCPPTRQQTVKVWGVEVRGGGEETWEGKDDETWSIHRPWSITIERTRDACQHSFGLVYRYDPDLEAFEFSMKSSQCPPQCTDVHGLRGYS
jgi:hypothetical protein